MSFDNVVYPQNYGLFKIVDVIKKSPDKNGELNDEKYYSCKKQ